ncbi:acyl-phosphate glycerol 3-phosphate acyltransferase [Bifidobacterium ramosum]|uniref:1-acyl-sn-glycerol-3-phosphate acyltransferase n=1 Tax=Bifidobacterium ramosum TaxID=1798158 RepID=A0A6L4X283_9BIFI|nr:lysophospholipid acyltransferase family protein [Bifidobacterium ramosum]KAB8288690.1 acyl-phosphate glycerol 3-phosphate acyltransferase [Bifidobacterium ramosum]NEG71446.1 1-acyl-sn-glycerol-3-phosphate acyltransferase [Bifidobacterium ramosum]
MASKGKPSPRSAVKPLSDEQVARLAKRHHLVDPMRDLPTGPNRRINQPEIDAQHPKGTKRLLTGVDVVFNASCKTLAWGLDNIPETGPFITAATHVTMFDVFVPMASLFHMGRRPRYMAKAEMAHWPLIGKWFQLVGMQPVQRRSGKAKVIEETSIEILTSGRPLTVWPEGTVTRDPKKWPMSMKNGVGVIALEASRRLGAQVPLFCAVTWGAASINHWWPWPRKNVVMCYDARLDYADLLDGCDTWADGIDGVPAALADELTRRIRVRMTEVMAEIRGEDAPDGYWDYRTMRRVKD